MKEKITLLAVVACLLAACTPQKDESVLLPDFTIPSETHPEWTELFTENYAITPLETTPECLIGEISKIKKFDGHYYITSSNNQTIMHFNEQGKFVSALDKLGQGPDEYERIEDFDVYQVDGQPEVWISDNLSLKIYDATDFTFKYKIPFPYVIHKFKRLENSHILLVTGQNDHTLTLTDKEGNVLSEYLKSEIPFIMFRAIQFVACGSEYLFQLGISNAYVAFDPETETFRNGVFTKETSYLSDKQLLELFDRTGMDFIMEAGKGSFINNFRSLRDITWIQTRNTDKKYLSRIQNGRVVSTEYNYGTVLSTMTSGDSDDSVLMYIFPHQLSEYGKEVRDKSGRIINCGMEDNPCILEFF